MPRYSNWHERADSKPVQCGFESHPGHQIKPPSVTDGGFVVAHCNTVPHVRQANRRSSPRLVSARVLRPKGGENVRRLGPAPSATGSTAIAAPTQTWTRRGHARGAATVRSTAGPTPTYWDSIS